MLILCMATRWRSTRVWLRTDRYQHFGRCCESRLLIIYSSGSRVLPRRLAPLQACRCRATRRWQHPAHRLWFKVKPKSGQRGLGATRSETISPLPSVCLNFGCTRSSLPASLAPTATACGPADTGQEQDGVTRCQLCGDILGSGAILFPLAWVRAWRLPAPRVASSKPSLGRCCRVQHRLRSIAGM